MSLLWVRRYITIQTMISNKQKGRFIVSFAFFLHLGSGLRLGWGTIGEKLNNPCSIVHKVNWTCTIGVVSMHRDYCALAWGSCFLVSIFRSLPNYLSYCRNVHTKITLNIFCIHFLFSGIEQPEDYSNAGIDCEFTFSAWSAISFYLASNPWLGLWQMPQADS